MKEGDDKYKQINERVTNIERKILDMGEKYENRSEVIKKKRNMLMRIKEKQW